MLNPKTCPRTIVRVSSPTHGDRLVSVRPDPARGVNFIQHDNSSLQNDFNHGSTLFIWNLEDCAIPEAVLAVCRKYYKFTTRDTRFEILTGE